MQDSSACAACLASDLRMYKMDVGGLLRAYQLLSGLQVNDEMPRYLCWECAALVNKFMLFRDKCKRAYLLLQDVHNARNEISEESIKNIDRKFHNLSSKYSRSDISIFNSVSNPDTIKTEQCIEEPSTASEPCKLEHLLKDEQDIVKIEPQIDFYEMPLAYAESASPKVERVARSKRRKTKRARRRKQEKVDVCRKEKKTKKNLVESFKATRVSLTQEQMMEAVSARRLGKGYRAARFKCTLCYKGFMEDKTYSNHMRLHDPTSGELECDICKVRLRSRVQAHCHISGSHMVRYRCQLCPSVATNKASAKKHYDWHKGVTYTCDICGAISAKLTTHLSHRRIKHPSQHICGACGDAFVSGRGLRDHATKTHGAGGAGAEQAQEGGAAAAYCAACDVQFSCVRVRTRHILISPRHERERALINNGCRDCGETFPTAAALTAHARAHHPPRAACVDPDLEKPVCIQCGAVQAGARAYWAHFRRAHPGETYPLDQPAPFVCELCGKAFKCNALLLTHLNVHEGIRNHKCAICPKSFFKSECLRAHLVSHSEERPYVCAACGKGFKLKWALQRHMRHHDSTSATSVARPSPDRPSAYKGARLDESAMQPRRSSTPADYSDFLT